MNWTAEAARLPSFETLISNLEIEMSDEQSARLGLTYLAAGQLQKHVTLNETLTRLDALLQTCVVSRTVAEQPAAPADGSLYILPEDADGTAWASRPAGALMRFEAGAWAVVETPEGLIALVADEGVLVVRAGSDWSLLGARLDAVQNLSRLGLGTGADATNPFAAKLNKALWTALSSGEGGDGDLRLTFNKSGEADVLSLLFQSNYGGRAELGLIGDDDLTLKVSPDGSAWTEALNIDRTTGRIDAPSGVGRVETSLVTTSGSFSVPAWARWIRAVCVGGGGGGGAGATGATGTARLGGAGGGAGGLSTAIWNVADLGGALTLTIGVGGAAGAAGGATSISDATGQLLSASGGSGGASASATGASGGAGSSSGPNGGGSTTTATAGAGSAGGVHGPGAGGAGGGVDTSNTQRSGGAGGAAASLSANVAGGSGGSGANGGAGSAPTRSSISQGGGGGGGGGGNASGAGRSGGAGAVPGGGGGGGGAGSAGAGAGGAGGAGCVILIVGG